MKKVIVDFVPAYAEYVEVRLTFVSDKFKTTEKEFTYLSISCIDDDGITSHTSVMNIVMFDEALRELDITHPVDIRTIREGFLKNRYIKDDFWQFFCGDGEYYLNEIVSKAQNKYIEDMTFRYGGYIRGIIKMKLAENKDTEEIEFTWDEASELSWLLGDIRKYEHTANCYCASEHFADLIDGYICDMGFSITKAYGHLGFKWDGLGKVSVHLHCDA